MTEEEVKKILITFLSKHGKYASGSEFYHLACEHKWKWYSGAFKNCFVIPDLPFVVKFGQDGKTTEATREVDIYNLACLPKYNCSALLPKTEVWFKAYGFTFVKQEKVTCTLNEWEHRRYGEEFRFRIKFTEKNQENLKKLIQDLRWQRMDGYFAQYLIYVHGLKTVRGFCKLVEKLHLNDFHGSNVGFAGKRPVIIDFAGA